MAEEKKATSKVWIWVIIIVLIVIAGGLVWYFTKADSSESTDTTETKASVVIPDGWKGYTSNKYGFSLSYPADYTLTEGNTGTFKLTKGSTEMIDFYAYAANGDEEGMMKSQEALYTDDAKGYMIMDSVVQSKVNGVTAKTVYGKFGKNAGVSQTHEGITGATTFLATADKLYVFDSFDNGDETAKTVFEDFLKTISL